MRRGSSFCELENIPLAQEELVTIYLGYAGVVLPLPVLLAVDIKPQIVVAVYGNTKRTQETRRLVKKKLPATEVIPP